ncbi:MurR/RpiR family transcriptional regulator [Labrys wisconsinensis]|uniref:DNA-binding MurR/RpiR family transcriptional regulator n=1 Tax=Labrys wisconsinensis TaxID=425677 RepID=A0ABU0JNS3_9HYPH|nr:MurR/RpiR family transcriptional regulator [Labrys wisconsinensis]MDQ0474929.1 DNA-binding MurR/RpiR family transcriptional regulator [Labrys wisconsinensis]
MTMASAMPDSAATDYDDFAARLAAQAASLPKRLRQVAAFATEHPDEVALGTAAEVAARAGVQPSTLVRFAKALDYDGFSELQQIFRSRLKERFPDYRERVALLRSAGGAGSISASLLEGFTQAAAVSLDRLRASADPALIDRAIDLLAEAEIIHLLGARRLFPVAAYLAYAFGKLGVRCALIDHVAQLAPEQMALAGPRDVVLALSFTPYAPATLDLAQAAARRGLRIVAVTDSPFSPLAALAAVRLDVVEADHGAFRSLAATFALAMTLAVGIAEKRGLE